MRTAVTCARGRGPKMSLADAASGRPRTFVRLSSVGLGAHAARIILCGLILATPASFAGQPGAASLVDVDVDCMARVGDVSPLAPIAMADLVSQCRVSPTAAVTTQLWRSAIFAESVRALREHLESGETPTRPALALPKASPELCARLVDLAGKAALPSSAPAQCEVPSVGSPGRALELTSDAQWSARCEQALGERVPEGATTFTAVQVVIRTTHTVVCSAVLTPTAPGQAGHRRRATILLDAKTAHPRGVDTWVEATSDSSVADGGA